jgi:hypothetical protein
MQQFITSDGSILFKPSNSKKLKFLKIDKNNNYIWKSLTKVSLSNSQQKFEKFKERFLKKNF